MRIIYKGRGEGKTFELIKMASENNLYIVARDIKAVDYIINLAKKHNFFIPYPLTYNEFFNRKYYGKQIKGFLIDDAEVFLQYLTTVPIEAISLTRKEIFKKNAEQ